MLKKLPLKGYVYTASALELVGVLVVLFAKSNLPPVVPLFYGRPVGAGQLVPSLGLLIAPLAAFIITAINIILSLRSKDEFIKRALSIASLFISLLAIITVVKIVLLIGFW